MKRCDICHEGIAEYTIEDVRTPMEKLETKPGQWFGDMKVCEYCYKKIVKESV